MNTRKLRIGDVNRLTGRTTEMIRRAEREGKIPLARRDSSGFRYWDEADLPAIYAGLHVKPPSALEENLTCILADAGLPNTLGGLCEYLAPVIVKEAEMLQGDKTVGQAAAALMGEQGIGEAMEQLVRS